MHIIYITGLGDTNPRGQRFAISLWRLWGVTSELFQMSWADQEPWQNKFDRLCARIELLNSKNQTVALVGASAGAGATINAFAARKDILLGCVVIAGKVNNPGSIGDSYKRKNPAFLDSAIMIPDSLRTLTSGDRTKILSRYALMDEVVSKQDSIIEGANNQRLLSMGHFTTIAFQITLGAPGFIRFLKKLDKKS